MMRKPSALAVLVWLGLTVATPATADAVGTVILVSPLQFGVDVYLKMTRIGTVSGAKEAGLAVKVFESTDPETRSENIRAALSYGATIVVAPGPEFIDIVPDFAEDNPNVKFLMIEDCPAKLAPNVYCVLLRTYEAGFLAGVEAGLTSKSGQVGTIAPIDYPEAHRFIDPYAAGAKYARNDIAIHSTLWIGGDNPWSDPLRAQSQAAAMLGDGADRILATVAAGNGGVFKLVANTPGALATGLDVNECPSAPGHILDSAVRHIDQVIARAVVGIAAGTQPNLVSYGLKDGAVNLTGLEPGAERSQCMIAQHPDVLQKLKEVSDLIVSGQMVIKDPAGIIQ